ncbi:MAG: radical SAM protein [Methylococcales bacterium]|jgi:radical SAM superfamily enzyme YgiQ (UPF0313 family)|nr:radical SAM protein [Methylococcales bacterium]MBT7410179.1 radical SAM protein [Methylococcales bacterium]
MKILLVNTNQLRSPDPVPPIGIIYVAGALRKAGHECLIFDLNFLADFMDLLQEEIRSFNPDVIGLSLRNIDNTAFPHSQFFVDHASKIVDLCRSTKADSTIVMGGSGFSLFPELLIERLDIDYGIAGEGENEMQWLLQQIEAGKPPETKLIKANSAEVNMDEMIPAWDLVDTGTYFREGGSLNIQTKRGCRYKCTYCTYPLLEGVAVRQRDPVSVVDEMEHCNKEYAVDYFFFVDNVFNYPEAHSISICKEILKRKLKISWTAYLTPRISPTYRRQSSPDELYTLYKEAGCKAIDFGTDAMNDIGLGSMAKGFTIDDINECSAMCRKHKIKFNHSLIFGAPGETVESTEETISNIIATQPTAVIASVGIRLYPNTPVANKLIKQGWIKAEEITVEPMFYIEESIKEYLMERLKEVSKQNQNWVIPGLNIKMNYPNIFSQLRAKGVKGPMWKMLG